MPSDDVQPRAEREQTDQSLRVERVKTDQALEEQVPPIDETANAVVNRARRRADAVLAAARAKADGQPATLARRAQPAKVIKRARELEDQALRRERAHADETLRDEHAEHVALLSRERGETDKDLSNERARADDALATRDEFLRIVSHDLRNMLSSMVAFAGLIATMASRENHGEKVLRYAQRIERSGDRMDRLINDLLDVASIEAGTLAVTREVGDPTHVVTEAVEAFQAQASRRSISLVTEIVQPLPLAAFDPARILQVLINLLSNAIKFTPANGNVLVHVESVADEIRFAVHDTGTGIPADRLEEVFVRFVQVAENDRRGVGLGLYISKCIVQGHGGRIWAESRLGDGSTFCFTVPLHVRP